MRLLLDRKFGRCTCRRRNRSRSCSAKTWSWGTGASDASFDTVEAESAGLIAAERCNSAIASLNGLLRPCRRRVAETELLSTASER